MGLNQWILFKWNDFRGIKIKKINIEKFILLSTGMTFTLNYFSGGYTAFD